MFQVGDKVVHPMHGAGVIDSIVDEKIGGAVIGLRAVVDAAAADAVIAALGSLEIEVTANWNKRYRENLERLKSGDLYEVARVIKCLMSRDAQRGLSNGERKMLHSAKQIFISEMVLAKDVPYSDIEGQVNACLVGEGA